MPSAIQRDAQLRDKGLVTVLMETQFDKPQFVEPFVWQRLQGAGSALVCTDCRSGASFPDVHGLPHAAIVGVDGTLVWMGLQLADERAFQEAIDKELAKVKAGWGSTPEVRKVRALLYGGGKLAEAQRALAAVKDEAESKTLQNEVKAVFDRTARSVRSLQDEGRWLEAQEVAKNLQKNCAGVADWAPQLTEMTASFATPEGRTELADDGKLAKVLRAWREDKLKGDVAKAIDGIARTAKGKVGERCQRIVKALTAPLQ